MSNKLFNTQECLHSKDTGRAMHAKPAQTQQASCADRSLQHVCADVPAEPKHTLLQHDNMVHDTGLQHKALHASGRGYKIPHREDAAHGQDWILLPPQEWEIYRVCDAQQEAAH